MPAVLIRIEQDDIDALRQLAGALKRLIEVCDRSVERDTRSAGHERG